MMPDIMTSDVHVKRTPLPLLRRHTGSLPLPLSYIQANNVSVRLFFRRLQLASRNYVTTAGIIFFISSR